MSLDILDLSTSTAKLGGEVLHRGSVEHEFLSVPSILGKKQRVLDQKANLRPCDCRMWIKQLVRVDECGTHVVEVKAEYKGRRGGGGDALTCEDSDTVRTRENSSLKDSLKSTNESSESA